jgi:hypothetical protein
MFGHSEPRKEEGLSKNKLHQSPLGRSGRPISAKVEARGLDVEGWEKRSLWK